MNSIVPGLQRVSIEDDAVLPLSDPIVLPSGEVKSELPIPKGTVLLTSIVGYNRWVQSRAIKSLVVLQDIDRVDF
jgi:hypothetical protein